MISDAGNKHPAIVLAGLFICNLPLKHLIAISWLNEHRDYTSNHLFICDNVFRSEMPVAFQGIFQDVPVQQCNSCDIEPQLRAMLAAQFWQSGQKTKTRTRHARLFGGCC
jgi:hypothetical protein